MKLNIQLLASGESKTLITGTRKKLEQFLRIHKTIREADVKLTYGRDAGGHKVCELYLKMVDKNIFTIGRAVTFEECVDKALKKMQARMEAEGMSEGQTPEEI